MLHRPVRWYWAALLSLVAYHVAGIVVLFLVFGLRGNWGPLEPILDDLHDVLQPIIGELWTIWTLILLLATGPALCMLFAYAWLRRGVAPADGYLHCLKCGYILKGLSAPRCPECGEPI